MSVSLFFNFSLGPRDKTPILMFFFYEIILKGNGTLLDKNGNLMENASAHSSLQGILSNIFSHEVGLSGRNYPVTMSFILVMTSSLAP